MQPEYKIGDKVLVKHYGKLKKAYIVQILDSKCKFGPGLKLMIDGDGTTMKADFHMVRKLI